VGYLFYGLTLDIIADVGYYISMENAWSYGAREVLAELERDAREGMELEGERCAECHGSGMEKLDPRTFDPIPCPFCGGSGIDTEGGQP
jgi:hypothetical protein